MEPLRYAPDATPAHQSCCLVETWRLIALENCVPTTLNGGGMIMFRNMSPVKWLGLAVTCLVIGGCSSAARSSKELLSKAENRQYCSEKVYYYALVLRSQSEPGFIPTDTTDPDAIATATSAIKTAAAECVATNRYSYMGTSQDLRASAEALRKLGRPADADILARLSTRYDAMPPPPTSSPSPAAMRTDNAGAPIAAAVGAAATIAASAGGKNAAQLQALGNALRTPDAAANGSAGPGGYGASGTGTVSADATLGTNVEYMQPLHCVGIVRSSARDPDARLVNRCGFKIAIAWCVTASTDPRASPNCEQKLVQRAIIEANQSIPMYNGGFTQARSIVCKYPFASPDALMTWSGGKFEAPCIHSSRFGA